MECMSVISKVDEPTAWCTGMHIPVKFLHIADALSKAPSATVNNNIRLQEERELDGSMH